MSGIDSASAMLVTSLADSPMPVGAQGGAGTVQTGASALATGAADPPAQTASLPQASTQTILSAVALELDAILRSGGEATPAVVGTVPLVANPAALAAAAQEEAGQAEQAGQTGQGQQAAGAADTASELENAAVTALLDDLLAADGGAAAALDADVAALVPDGTAEASGFADLSGASSQAAQAAQSASAASGGAVAALAAALQQTVADSGLFYESHLAQWLAGQLSLADVAGEPQNQLVAEAGQLPLPLELLLEEQPAVDELLWLEDSSSGYGSGQAAQGSQAAGSPSAQAAAARTVAADMETAFEANEMLDAFGAPATSALHLLDDASGGGAADSQSAAQAQTQSAATMAGAMSVHAAVIPLVRQQLDLLATGEFRWTGEAWPGARLDWTVQQPDEDGRGGHRGSSRDALPWRTRVTLALPALGTVDAELTLTGATLSVRVQASPGGAQRLAANSESLRHGLQAAGLQLTGLSIREIGGGAPAPAGANAEAAKAVSAYARAAAEPAAGSPPASSGDDFGVDI
ncbi:flagellar hook-length control protein FliK [Burkholderia sp. WAC0059]|uniref:flagellar hook-length control protein FliK n=1 Tax=Burkholderia sp. WAC0059 TaxID=2066022 RepID=UPI000C7EF5FB|nr:flagellar hook-length control protein FliK [Burkholderia sp. WAC0059]PLZ00684.1 flagellar hook-length control protein FliK [Burkholderia sp. WAC0059]